MYAHAFGRHRSDEGVAQRIAAIVLSPKTTVTMDSLARHNEKTKIVMLTRVSS